MIATFLFTGHACTVSQKDSRTVNLEFVFE